MLYLGPKKIFNPSEQYQLVMQIEKEEEFQKKRKEEGNISFSLTLAKYMSVTGLGDIFIAINSVLSLVYVINHAVDTYSWPVTNITSSYQTPKAIVIIEIILDVFFFIDFLINFYISENRLFFTFQYNSILEYTSVLPSLFVRMNLIPSNKYAFVTRALRFLLIIRIESILSRRSKDITRNTFKILFTILSIMIEASSFLMVVEQDQGLFFHDFLYFMAVTMSTVGFGDIYPQTIFGRLIVIVSILILLALIPAQVDQLTKSIKQTSGYSSKKLAKKRGCNEHILILGNALVEGYKTFLSELYHQDHGIVQFPSVIMKNQHPSDDMLKLLQKNSLQTNLTYLFGNPLSNNDLKRAQAENAQCVVILADKMTSDPQQEDHRNIMYTLAVKQYVYNTAKTDIRVCLQLLNPELKDIYFESLDYGQIDQVICVDELKLYLLAKTCQCPGINTIISFLITSDKPDVSVVDKRDEDSWINDYIMGMQNEIYRVHLDQQNFSGYTFCTVSQQIFKELGIILFALEVKVYGETKLFINPADYLIQDSEHYGYVIASQLPNQKDLQKVRIDSSVPRNHSYPNVPKQVPGTSNLKEIITNDKDSKYRAFYQNRTRIQTLQLNHSTDKKFENHYIVCGIVSGMKHLLMPLRARSLKTINPIIILNNETMPSELWNQINSFPKVYFLQGSPLKQEDLERACVKKALALVILSKPREKQSDSSGMVDADTIFIYKTVKFLNPNIQIITELASMATISFLSQSKNSYIKEIGYIASEPFASGEIYISTMLDTLICQAYYNPFIINILDQLIMGGASRNIKIKKICNILRLQSANLFLIDIPPQFSGQNFGQIYKSFVIEYKMIPIGLYRGINANKNNKPYVFLKPSADVKTSPKDKVYVLSIKQPKEQKIDIEEGSQFQQQQQQQYPNMNLKSKLQGEEGRIDVDIARNVFKLSGEMDGFINDLKTVNESTFHKNLASPDLIPQIRQIFKQEISNINYSQ
ncbi:hypothetical protein ABPG74_004658 [Tetrahymena malaccensis]